MNLKNYRFRNSLLLTATAVMLLSATPLFPHTAIADDLCGWATVQKWKVKMHLTQVLDRTGPFAQGSTCNYDYTLGMSHISDVTGEFTSTGTSGSYQGSLTSQESVNNHLDLPAYGDPNCPIGSVYFIETCADSGSEEDVSLSIDPAMGKYSIAFPHTGIDCETQYVSSQGSAPIAFQAEINSVFVPAWPGFYGRIMAASPSDPVTTLEFPLPGSSPTAITGETTFPHQQYPEIPVTWSWELTPDAGTGERELGAPDGVGKGSGGDMAPGSGFGSPTWTVNTTNLNIFITDTPLWYKSPVGPAVEVAFSYNSKAVYNRFEPAGRNWQLNYESYLSSDPATGDVTIYMPDGRRDLYTYDSNTGKFTPPYRVFNELTVIREGEIMEGSDYQLAFPDGTTYIYKVPSGQLLWAFLTEIRDPHYPTDPANKLTLSWDPLPDSPWGGKLTRITDALGRSTTFFYNGDGRINSILDPFGRTATLGYDTNGNLTRITDMGGFYSTFTYDGCGTIQTLTTGNNKVTFTQGFNTLTVADYMGSETFTFNPLTGETSYQGANAPAGTTYGYTRTATPDGNSDITGFRTPEGVGFDYTYDTKGNLLTQTLQGAAGAETAAFTYNSRGKVLSVVPPIGARTDLTYAANGIDTLTVTQAGLGTITAVYNTTHDILSLTDRMGLLKTFTFNLSGQVTSSLGAGILTGFSYDGGSRQLTGITRGTTVGSYGYDAIGRLTSYTDQNGFTLRRSYNNLDDLLSMTYPDNTSATFTRSTAVPHLLDSMTDQAGRKTSYFYNPHSQLREILDPAGGRTRFTYDAAGHGSELIDPNNNSTFFSYNKDNRLTRKQFSDGSSVQFAYPNGRMTWSKNARGDEATYSYDRNGNLLTVAYSDGTPGVTTVYDPYNRPVTVTDALGTRVINYDASSRVTSIDGPWANDTLTFSYDSLGRKTAVALQGGLTATYVYDTLDRLTSITGNGTTYTYSYQGGETLLQRLARSDNSRTDYSYDPVMKRLQQQISYTPAGTTLNGYSYTFDSLGQPTGETVTNSPALSFATAGVVDATYNGLNQVLTWGGSDTAIAYDADGNMTSGLTPDGRAFTAAYDAENRMKSIQYTDAGGIVRRQEYTYGSDGYIGIQKSYANGSLTAERRYIWDSGKLLQERDAGNAPVRDYLWGINQPGGVGALLSLKQGGAVYQAFSNPRGDITAILNSSGAVVASYAYDPFGGTLSSTGTLNQPIRYSTKLYDEGTGLYYFGHRFYSPQLGRWLSRDPLAEMASINLYRFAANNPLTHFDPFGAADNGGFWDRPEVQAQLQAQREAMQAKRASEVTTFEKVKSSIGSAFKWIGDKFKAQPEMARSIEEKVAETALEANKYTKAGKEWNERINTAIQIAEDYGTVKAALKDDDPASGLTLIKVGAKYTVGRIPVVGEAYSEVIVKGVETVENAPGGVKAMRNAGAKADAAYYGRE